jgi:hypothetical protein
VRANGSPGRKEAHVMYLWKLERPADGLRYAQVGLRPYLTTGRGASRPAD